MPSHYDRDVSRRGRTATPRQAGPPATGQPAVRSAIPQPRSPLNPQRLTTPQPQLPLPSERVRSIVETDSPLMRQAATQGKQYAHRRGLLNSSIAAGATQNSLLAHAFPMAQADTSAALQGRSLDINRQQTDDAWQQSLIDYALNRDRFISDTDLRNRQLTLTDRINTGRLDLDRERFMSDAEMAQDRLGLDRELGTRRLDLESRGLDLGYDRLAQDRRQASYNTYAGMWSALLNNPNIDKDTREEYMESLRNFLDEMEEGEGELDNTPTVDPDGDAAAGAETALGGPPQEPPPEQPPPQEPPPEQPPPQPPPEQPPPQPPPEQPPPQPPPEQPSPQEPPPQEPPPQEPPPEQPPPQPPQTQDLPPPGNPGWNSIPTPGGVPSWDLIPYHSRHIFV